MESQTVMMKKDEMLVRLIEAFMPTQEWEGIEIYESAMEVLTLGEYDD